jgi:hypothetical protein
VHLYVRHSFNKLPISWKILALFSTGWVTMKLMDYVRNIAWWVEPHRISNHGVV